MSVDASAQLIEKFNKLFQTKVPRRFKYSATANLYNPRYGPPTGYVTTLSESEPLNVSCLHGTFYEQLVAKVLEPGLPEEAIAFRAREEAVRESVVPPGERREPDLECLERSGARDSHCWDACVGKGDFVGIFSARKRYDADNPRQRWLLVAYVRSIKAARDIYDNLLRDAYGKNLTLLDLATNRDYLNLRQLSQRNAVRVLYAAARGYDLRIKGVLDGFAADRENKAVKPEMGCLRRLFCDDARTMIRPNYRNEASVLLRDSLGSSVTYFDGCTHVGDAIGGLLYVSRPGMQISLVDFEALEDDPILPEAWPHVTLNKPTPESDTFAMSQRESNLLRNLSDNQATCLFDPVSVVTF